MTTVSATVHRVVNTGNFENVKLEFSLTDDVKPGESNEQALDRVFNEVDIYLDKRVDEVHALMDSNKR